MIPAFIDKTAIPHKPGVYIYKDTKGKILYVGKAIDLYHRVASYFTGKFDNPKTESLVQNIAHIDTIIVTSELEALILEANLIKKHLPPYNIRLTDDKDYLYIKVTKEPFPRILTARKNDLNDAKQYFGPFPSSRIVKITLKKLRRIFPWCTNPNQKGKSCFYYHLHLCPGACVGKISTQEYQKIINRFIRFMQGQKVQLLEDIEKEMHNAAHKLNFEEANRLKKMLEGINYLLQPNQAQIYLETPNFVEQQNKLAVADLQQSLKLPTLPNRIECYDISNIAGQQAVGSLVVLSDGDLDKKWYRKFKIKITGKPNDVGMMREMLSRRVKHEEWPKPDLIIIDGGRGQVRAAKDVLDQVQWPVPVYGLAKRMEWLYTPETDIVKLKKSSLSLRLLQKIRDEAHRFAVTFHRQLRSKNLLTKY